MKHESPDGPTFDDLPEPARAKAHEVYEQLLEEGRSEEEARTRALEMAKEWAASRAPTS